MRARDKLFSKGVKLCFVSAGAVESQEKGRIRAPFLLSARYRCASATLFIRDRLQALRLFIYDGNVSLFEYIYQSI